MIKRISDDDSNLFRDSIGGVKTLKQNRITHSKTQKTFKPQSPEPEYHNVKLDCERSASVKLDDTLYFFRTGVQKKQLKLLRQGKLNCQMEADLHGCTLAETHKLLEALIYEAVQSHYRVIRIIHGKGYRSESQAPVLKNFINQALPEFADVLAFCSAQPKDGGSGAVYVLLKRATDSPLQI